MTDLTLYEYSGLKKEEIRSRLDQEYKLILNRHCVEDAGTLRYSNQGFIKTACNNMRLLLKILFNQIINRRLNNF